MRSPQWFRPHLRSGDEQPSYAKRTNSSNLDPFAEKFSTCLALEATKSRKQRRTFPQLHTATSHRCNILETGNPVIYSKKAVLPQPKNGKTQHLSTS